MKCYRKEMSGTETDVYFLGLREPEERPEQSSELMAQQAELLEDLVERLDFAERPLTRQRMDEPRALQKPEESTPV